MAKLNVEPVNTSDTFQVWLNKTNEIVTLLETDVMTASVLGDTTIGNSTLIGNFIATNVTATGNLTANTALVTSIENKDNINSNIQIRSPLNINNNNKNIITLTAPTGPVVRFTNQFPITWNVGLSSETASAEFQISRGIAAPLGRFTSNSEFILDGTAIINQDLFVTGAINGNATSSSILETARNISATGDINWTVSFNGSGDVTNSAVIQPNVISNEKIRQSGALSVLGRSSNAVGNIADISASINHQVLRRSGSVLEFGAIALNQAAAVSGILPVANGGTGQSSFVAGRITFGGTTLNTDTQLFWDNSNKRLGINNTNPTEKIDVGGNVKANVFIGLATSANYADLAEKFIPDEIYEYGTVVYIGGDKEITKSIYGCKAIGVISEFPALMMNSEQTDGVFVALKGRVPVLLIDNVKKGDIIVPGNNGKGKKGNIGAPNILGIALTDSENNVAEMLVL